MTNSILWYLCLIPMVLLHTQRPTLWEIITMTLVAITLKGMFSEIQVRLKHGFIIIRYEQSVTFRFKELSMKSRGIDMKYLTVTDRIILCGCGPNITSYESPMIKPTTWHRIFMCNTTTHFQKNITFQQYLDLTTKTLKDQESGHFETA